MIPDGFSYPAAIYLRQYQLGYSDGSGDWEMLERALKMARTTIALEPESSRAYPDSIYCAFCSG